MSGKCHNRLLCVSVYLYLCISMPMCQCVFVCRCVSIRLYVAVCICVSVCIYTSGGDGRENNQSEGEGSGGDKREGEGSGETGAKETGGKVSGQNVMEGIERKSYSAAVIEGVRKRARVFVEDSIVRKTDRVLNKGDDVVVCLPGAKIEAITERVENIVGSGKGGSVLVHVGTNNVEREGTTAIVRKYRQLVRTLKQTRVEQVILSGILPVIGRRGHKYRNCRGMAINMLAM